MHLPEQMSPEYRAELLRARWRHKNGLEARRILTMATAGWLIAASLLAVTPCQGAPTTPELLRFRVRSVLWSSHGFGGERNETTDYFDVRSGDDIDGPRAYPGWLPFGPGAPFRLGKIVDRDHAWVHFSGGIRPRASAIGGDKPSGGDSIIVSTVDRSFTSGSYDGGIVFSLRIEGTGSGGGTGVSDGMQIIHRGPVVLGREGFRERVEDAEAIGIFRILAVRPGRDSVRRGDRHVGTTELEVVPGELWRPGPLAVGKPLTLIQESPPTNDTSWTPMPGSTPMRRGDDVILFLLHGRSGPPKDRWTFSTYGGYGLLANLGKLVFSHFGRGIPIEKFRDDVRLSARMTFKAGTGILMGRVLHAGSGRPITGAAVRIQGNGAVSQTTPDGWFQLFDIPIGQHRLVVNDSLGEVSAPIEVTDERVDSLEVRIAQPDDAAPATPVQGGVPADGDFGTARPKNSDGFQLLRRPYDVAPMPFRRSDPSYPEDARKAAFEGDVTVYALIDSLGYIVSASSEGSMSPQILAAAEACVRRWKFRPALKGGRPVESRIGLNVHFAHPASDNIAAMEDRRAQDTASFAGDSGSTRSEIVVEASATLDSVTKEYRYYYRVMNRPGSTRDLVAFALMPAAAADMNLDKPEGWNGFLGCGGRRDVIGWMAWGDDRHRGRMDFAIAPNQELSGIGFRSARPPTRIRWFAQTVARGEPPSFAWACGSSHTEIMLETPLQGTIVGPTPEH